MGLSRRGMLVGAGLTAVVLASGCGDGSSRRDGGSSEQRVRWKKSFTNDPGASFEPMTVVAGGDRLYATHGGVLYGLDAATGKQLWQSPDGTYSKLAWPPQPPILADQTLYLIRETEDATRVLKAIDATTGALKWDFGEPGGWPHPWPAVGEGKVCLSVVGGFAVLDATSGKALWAHAHRIEGLPMHLPFGAPVIDEGAIYLTDDRGDLGSFDLGSDSVRWSLPRSNTMASPWTITVADGLVVTCGARSIYAFDAATGKQRWSVEPDPGIGVYGRSLIAGDTILVPSAPEATTGGNTVYALDRTGGGHRWTYTTREKTSGAPAVRDGVVYVATRGSLHAVDLASGANRWTVTVPNTVFGPPTIGNGTVFSFAQRGPADTDDLNDHLYAVAV